MSLLAAAAAALLLTGCGEEKVTTYRVPKEKDEAPRRPRPTRAPADAAAPAAPGAAMADTAVPTADDEPCLAGAGGLGPKPAGAMRKASYSVPGDARRVRPLDHGLPGRRGRRARQREPLAGQLALPPLGPDELDGAVSRVEANGLKFTLVELAPGGRPGGQGDPRRHGPRSAGRPGSSS
jgi:hypothetical protein